MARDLKPRNDSNINSPDFEILVNNINKNLEKNVHSERINRIKSELLALEKNTLTRSVIFEKYIIPNFNKKNDKIAYQKMRNRISNLVEDFPDNKCSIDWFAVRPSGFAQLDTSNVKTELDEAFEYYASLGANIELF